MLVSRADQHALFDEAFRLLWTGREALPPAVGELLSRSRLARGTAAAPSRRLAEALARAGRGDAAAAREEAPVALAWSDRELLRHRDFEAMSTDELREAERAVARLRFAVRNLRPGGTAAPCAATASTPGRRCGRRFAIAAASRSGGARACGAHRRWWPCATSPGR